MPINKKNEGNLRTKKGWVVVFSILMKQVGQRLKEICFFLSDNMWQILVLLAVITIIFLFLDKKSKGSDIESIVLISYGVAMFNIVYVILFSKLNIYLDAFVLFLNLLFITQVFLDVRRNSRAEENE